MCKRGSSVVGQMYCEPPRSSVRRVFNAFLCAEEFGHVESSEIWTLPVWGVLEGFWPVPFNFRCMTGPCPGHLNLQVDVICCQISRQIGGLLLMQWSLGISPVPSSPAICSAKSLTSSYKHWIMSCTWAMRRLLQFEKFTAFKLLFIPCKRCFFFLPHGYMLFVMVF